MNCTAVIPFSLLQGIGRPDITGKLFFVELPIYLACAWMLMKRLGIEGAAIAFTGRVTLEALVLLALSQHFLPKHVFSLKRFAASITLAVSALYVATLPAGLVFKCLSLFCALLAFVFIGWFLVLKPEERLFLARRHPTLAVTDSHITESVTSRTNGV
jgi:O-antigen/teichoic acid export membrane protein